MSSICLSRSYLRHNLQLLPLPNVLALADSLLQLLHNLLVQRRRTRNRHLYLASCRTHQRSEFLAHSLERAQAVVLGQSVEEVLDGVVLVLHVGRLLNLGDDLLLVGDRESGRSQNLLELSIALEGLVQVVQSLGDGVEGTLLGGSRVLHIAHVSHHSSPLAFRCMGCRTRALA